MITASGHRVEGLQSTLAEEGLGEYFLKLQ